MNYLELVNEAIREAGISLSRLTSHAFLNPEEDMHVRFKGWVARAWRELQISREGWTFMSKRDSGLVYPRIYVNAGNLPGPPVPGDLFTGVDSRATFRVMAVTTVKGAWALRNAEAYLDVDAIVSSIDLGESFDRVSSPAATNAFKYAGRGRWNLKELAPDFDTLDYGSLFLTDRVEGNASRAHQLRFLHWGRWNDYREGALNGRSRPKEFTETPDRQIDLWPSPDKPYQLYFNYKRRLIDLINHNDTPDLDDQYHELLVWMAVMAYAAWDEKPGIYRYADKHMRKWRLRVENKYLPKLGWGSSVYDGC